MGPLQLYTVTVNGYATRMRLNAADAERLGGVPVGPAARTTQATEEPPTATAKRRTTRNKARTSANKTAG